MSGRNVLVVGSGAREHALLWKLSSSPHVARLYAAPGNGGTASLAVNVPIAATDVAGIVRFVEERDVDLTVVGPEAPLALGLADAIRAAGRKVVGPSAAAARIEGSKAFAKDVMRRAGVPTARCEVFSDPHAALRYVDSCPLPVVIKADGLAAGKGVMICGDHAEVRTAVRTLMVEEVCGDAGRRIVVEEYLSGPEVSLIALVDGERVVPFLPAQDHKRLLDGDMGPNTGGMGAYAPVSFLTPGTYELLLSLTVEPIVRTLAAMGTPYRGVLFAGLMLTAEGPRVLEYNCRFGDPEAQVLLPLVRGDLLPWLDAVADGELQGQIPFHTGAAVGVVLATPGYPERPITGARITGLDDLPADTLVFHGGTARDEQDRVVTAGGRAVTVVGLGPTVMEAAIRAYAAPVAFEGMRRRTDIARQGMSHGREPDTAPFSTVHRGQSSIVVLASGAGSNLQVLIDGCSSGRLDARISAVVSHDPDAASLVRAREAGIPTFVLRPADRNDRAERQRMERDLLAVLEEIRPHLVVLAGWMLILSADFVRRCPCATINIHPALLPDGQDDPLFSRETPVLRGLHAVRDALLRGLPYTGVTVHHITAAVDDGPIVRREVVPIVRGDDEDALYRRIKAVEHHLLIEAVETVLSDVHAGGVHAANIS